jgi:hypothetical protein
MHLPATGNLLNGAIVDATSGQFEIHRFRLEVCIDQLQPLSQGAQWLIFVHTGIESGASKGQERCR